MKTLANAAIGAVITVLVVVIVVTFSFTYQALGDANLLTQYNAIFLLCFALAIPTVIILAIAKLVALSRRSKVFRGLWDQIIQSASSAKTPIEFISGLAGLKTQLIALYELYSKGWLFGRIMLVVVAICGLLGGLIAFIPAQLQAIRLREQNILLSTQNRLLIETNLEQKQRELAAQKLQEIREILLDRSSSIQSQVYAVKQIPEAMVMEVRSAVDVKLEDSIDYIISYPNLLPLRALLSEYLRLDRTIIALKHSDGMFADGSVQVTDLEQLRKYEPVSTELFKLLHRLGPAETGNPGQSVWSFKPDGRTLIPRLRDPDIGSINVANFMIQYVGETTTIDLQYLDSGYFSDVNLPFAFSGGGTYIIRFRRGAEFSRCRFQGCTPFVFVAEDCAFNKCNLSCARFDVAKLNGATFSECNLDGALLNHFEFNNGYFSQCQLNGMIWINGNAVSSSFRDCSLGCSQFVSSRFWDGEFLGCEFGQCVFLDSDCWISEFSDCSFIGSAFTQCKFQSTSLQLCALDGARLSSCDFARSNLVSITMSGCEVNQCKFEACELSELEVGPRDVTLEYREIHVPDYQKKMPRTYYSQRNVAGQHFAKMETFENRFNETIRIPRIVDGESTKLGRRITLAVPEAIIFGPTSIGKQANVFFIELEPETEPSCIFWDLTGVGQPGWLLFPSEEMRKLTSSLAADAWPRIAWESDLKRLGIHDFKMRSESRGGLEDLAGSLDSMFVDSEAGAWLDPLVSEELNDAIEILVTNGEPAGLRLRNQLKNFRSTADSTFSVRRNWNLNSEADRLLSASKSADKQD